jgi:glycyl-tRNA synthetase beta chain
MEEAGPRVRRALEARDYPAALTELAGLRPDVDRFFEAVLVMDKDPVVQENRLGLLRALADQLLAVADLRRIVPAATP